MLAFVMGFSASQNSSYAAPPDPVNCSGLADYGSIYYDANTECFKGCHDTGWKNLNACSGGVGMGIGCADAPLNADLGEIKYDSTLKCFKGCTGSGWIMIGECGAPAFVTTWKTNNAGGVSANNQITLPLVNGGMYNFTVNWGDDNTDTITSWNQAQKTHTYSSAGTYTVSIKGTIIGFNFNWGGDKNKLTQISQWGPLNPGEDASAFLAEAYNLQITASDAPDLTGVKNISSAFYGYPQATISNINAWDMSDVENMSSMFGDTAFNSPIGNWDVSKVTNMSYMFSLAYNFNQPIGNWDVSNVTDMSGMFSSTDTFNQPLDNWNVSSVTTMNAMFSGATAFNQPLGSWDVTRVEDMSGMFNSASSFDQNLVTWNIPSMTDMSSMFLNAELSVLNYSGLLRGLCDSANLNGWPYGITFDGGNSTYNTTAGGYAAHKAHDCLTDDFGWTITDGGQVP